MRHTVTALVENSPGVLTRVAGLFSRRGFNIDSLAVGVTEDPRISRMTIVVEGSEATLEQLTKQLNKLINVIKVTDLKDSESVARELALVKIAVEPAQRAQITQLVDIFRGKIIDMGRQSVIVELTGDETKVDAFLNLARDFGIKEVVRTGRIAMARGMKSMEYQKEEKQNGQNIL